MIYKPDHDFELDLPKGEETERTIAFLLHMKDGEFIEAKRDLYVSTTGNVAIEYECRGKPSGISTTRAQWWAILLNGKKYDGEVVVLIRTERLKAIARNYIGTKRDIEGGDNKEARMILLPVQELMSP